MSEGGVLMALETKRLILRPWQLEDAPVLYELAKEEEVAFNTGWMPHQSLEESIQILNELLIRPEIYAILNKESKKVIGCISLSIGSKSNLHLSEEEGEIGYWIGIPYWGQGYAPEACCELIRHGLEDLHLNEIWSAYFDGNERSKRVQQKCGFIYHHTNHVYWTPLHKEMIEHVTKYKKRRYS